MFSQFFGNYLLENQKINTEQYSSCMKYIAANRVKLGMLAEHEDLLDHTLANELNYLQLQNDRQIGDLAIEKGYLTESDVNYLLGCQGNPYLIFVQALEDNHYMTHEEIETALKDYQASEGFSDAIMDAIKDGNISRLLPAFADIEDERYQTLLGLALRNIVRFISSYIRLEKGYVTDSIHSSYLAYQDLNGDFEASIGFFSDNDGILSIAEGYAREEFEEVDEDALDAIGEFVNCISGLYAAELSYQDVKLDTEPPEYGFDMTLKKSGRFFVLPLYIEGKESNLFIQIN